MRAWQTVWWVPNATNVRMTAKMALFSFISLVDNLLAVVLVRMCCSACQGGLCLGSA